MNTHARKILRARFARPLRAAVALALCAGTAPAMAGPDSFALRATGPTHVYVGAVVGFAVDQAYTLESVIYELPGDPPVEGLPFWGDVNRYLPGEHRQIETWEGDEVSAFVTNLADPITTVMQDKKVTNFGPTGTWEFAFQFWTPGDYWVEVQGRWGTIVNYIDDRYYVTEHWRGFYADVEGPYWDGRTDMWRNSGDYPKRGLLVTVAVPEPETCGLLLAGLGVLGAIRRQRRAG
ncbi:MAG: PEP-CTERM sorting domain-containing protein [Rhodocyclaceae bacterium]|nr:PEP-CTERM sorting domain-containing protein [Rhodocyclaceae bacterium]